MRRSPLAALSGALLIGFALRVINLDGRSVWYDEAFAILFAAKSFSAMLYGTATQVQRGAADVHPLFYYSLLHLWMGLAGESAFAARFLSIGFGLATVAVLYRLSYALFGAQTALVSGLMLAVAPFHIAYSQEARMYAQLGFFAAAALLGLVNFERTRRIRWWLLFVLAGTGVVYSHNLGFLVLFTSGLYVLARRDLSLLKATALAGIVMTILWLPWLILLPSEIGKVSEGYWVPRPDLASFVQTIVSFTVGLDNARVPSQLLASALFVAILFLLQTIYTATRHREPSVGFLVLMALIPPISLLALSQWRPVYITRALMPSFLAIVALVAWALTQMPKQIRFVPIGIGLVVMVASLGYYYQYAEYPRSPFRDALDYLETQADDGDTIVHDNKLSYFPMHYYDPGLVQSFVADPPGAGSDTLAVPTQQALGIYASPLAGAAQGYSRVWFVIFEQAVTEGGGNLAWLNNNYRLAETQRFNDLDIYLYQK